MLRALLVLVALAARGGRAESVLRLDLSPEEAARFLSSKPFATPELSPLQTTRPLVRADDARFRADDAGPTRGHYWRGGRPITDTDRYLEEVYDAEQFHGQDGLGAYAYGYRTPESAKTEDRARSGDVSGQYVFRDGNDRLVQVRYWADGEGFHQEDNLPRDLPQDTPEVQAAREQHARAWHQAAAAAAQPDRRQYDAHQQYDGQQHQYTGAGEFAAASQLAPHQATAPQLAPQHAHSLREPEPTGPPRGFFYSFTYPVSVIVDKQPQSGPERA